MSSSAVVEDLGRVVDALVALRPETLSVAELQASVAGVLPLIDRLGGWVDVAVGELAARAGGQVPAAHGSGRAMPVQAWLRDTTLCGGSAAGTRVQIAKLLRQLPQIADAVLTGQVSQASAAVLTRLIGPIDMEQLLACQPALIEVAAGRDPQALGLWVRELIATHCEPQLDHDERTAQDKRYLQTRNNHDGTLITSTSGGSFLLPAATPRAC
jgi:hypothetical protein